MEYRVAFVQEAHEDITEAIAWYRGIEEGLEHRFKTECADFGSHASETS